MRLSNTAVCFSCLGRFLPGWDDGKIGDWLISQAEAVVAWDGAHTKAALKAREERDYVGLKEWLGA